MLIIIIFSKTEWTKKSELELYITIWSRRSNRYNHILMICNIRTDSDRAQPPLQYRSNEQKLTIWNRFFLSIFDKFRFYTWCICTFFLTWQPIVYISPQEYRSIASKSIPPIQKSCSFDWVLRFFEAFRAIELGLVITTLRKQ